MQLTFEQQLIQESARQFAQTELLPNSAQWAHEGTLPRNLFTQLGTLGFMGILIPETFCGSALHYMDYALIMEEIAAGDAACSTIVSVHNSVGTLPILHYGTTAQKEAFLPSMAQGKHLVAFALSEPEAGSDAGAIQCRAARNPDGSYCLSGNKQFITAGKMADYAIVIAKTAPEAGKLGLSAFIIPTDSEGYEVVTTERKMGQEACETVQLRFNNLRLTPEQRLGEEGQGYKIALSQLESGRIGIAAQAIGIARHAFELAKRYAHERQSFGQPLIKHQIIAFRLADMATKLEAARALLWHAASTKDAQKPALTLAAMAKVNASEMAEFVCREALQIFGGYGYLKDFEVERLYRDARVTSIYEGTNEIQRLIIARHLSEHA